MHVEKTTNNCSEHILWNVHEAGHYVGEHTKYAFVFGAVSSESPSNDARLPQQTACAREYLLQLAGRDQRIPENISIAGWRNPDGDTHVMAISDICCNVDIIRLKEIRPQMYTMKGEIEVNQAIYCQRQAQMVHR